MMQKLTSLLLITALLLPSVAFSHEPIPFYAVHKETPCEPTRLQYRSRTPRQFFEDLPRHIGNDLKETFWNPWHIALLAAGTGVTLAVHEADPEIQETFHPDDPLGGAGDVFNRMGYSWLLGGGTLTAFAISKLANAQKAALTAGTMFEAYALTMAFTFALKATTRRERPDGSNKLSFPSAHASGAFTLATVIEIFHGPLYGIPSYALASMIALSRMDANKHFATDTMAGALLGTLIGLGVAKFHKKEFKNFFVIPTASNDFAGMTFIHTF